MKKIITLVVLAVAMALPSQAQFNFGVKGGLNLTDMSVSKSLKANLENQTGFFVGPTVKFTVPVVGLSLDASALYDQRSAKLADETIKEQSIQIPVNVRYGIGLGSIANVFAFAGPQFGFNIGSKSFSGMVEDADDWRLRDSSLSANFGIGATILGHLQVTANYNLALGKTGEFDLVDQTVGTIVGETKSHAWQIALAYYF